MADNDRDAIEQLREAGVVVITVPRQWFATKDYAWNTHLGDQLVGYMMSRGLATNETIDPQVWASVIVHDPLFGPDPDPHTAERPDWIEPEFTIEINKYDALALAPEACQRPALAIPFPGKEEYQIIDGWKRIYRAYRLGMTSYPVYAATREVEEYLRIPLPQMGY